MKFSTDPDERFNLKIMHELWSKLLDESDSMSPRRLTHEIAVVEEIQSVVDGRR